MRVFVVAFLRFWLILFDIRARCLTRGWSNFCAYFSVTLLRKIKTKKMLLAKRIGLMFIRTIHKFYYLYYKQRIALQIVYGYVFFLQFLMRTQSFAFRFFSLLLIINCCQFVTIVHECMLNAVHTEFKHYYNDTR